MLHAPDYARWTGGVLQIAAIVEIAWEVRSARKAIIPGWRSEIERLRVAKARIAERIRQYYWDHLRRASRPTTTVEGTFTALWNVEATAVITPPQKPAGEPTPQEREKYIDAVVEHLLLRSENLGAAIQVTEQRTTAREQAMRQAHAVELAAVDAKYRDLNVRGLRLKWWSAVFLIAGTALQTWPYGIVRLF